VNRARKWTQIWDREYGRGGLRALSRPLRSSGEILVLLRATRVVRGRSGNSPIWNT